MAAVTESTLADRELVISRIIDAPRMRVFQGEVEERSWRIFTKRRSPVRAVDLDGVIRVQRSHSVVRSASARTGFADVRRLWEDTTIYNGDSVITPDMFVIIGSQALHGKYPDLADEICQSAEVDLIADHVEQFLTASWDAEAPTAEQDRVLATVACHGAVRVDVERVRSWDHRKLGMPARCVSTWRMVIHSFL